jgi:phosphohistidine phosphatase
VITLHLVRHAEAVDADPESGDAARPLTAKGAQQARTLATVFGLMGVRGALVCCSPRLRARQTAELLAPEGPEPTVVAELGAGDAAATAEALAAALAAADGALRGDEPSVVAVGHEPFLSELAAHLLAGATDALAIHVRKASVITLHGPLAAAGMTLAAFVPMRILRALLEAPRGGAPD